MNKKTCKMCDAPIAGRGSTGLCKTCTVRVRWSDPKYKEKMAEIMKEALNRPETIERFRNRAFSLRTRIKLSIAHAGERNGFFGHHHSIETKEMNSIAHKGKSAGPNNPNWKGGIQPDPYSNTFTKFIKNQVRERDGFKCQDCGKPEGDRHHHVHHVSQNKQETKLRAFLTLCPLCHAVYHPDRGKWLRVKP